ncbi:MAG: hypothetical protein KJO51_08885 [Gramella sp.]|nr:hypothetical protein [Christiangramia sp.]
MKITIFFLALIYSFSILYQEEKVPEVITHSKVLCVGDGLQVGNKTLKFNKVISDSRCPIKVTCIWAGEVKILIEFYENGEFKGDKIVSGANTSIAEYFNVGVVDISGFAVTPYPELNYKISPEEYSLYLKVSEKLEIN